MIDRETMEYAAKAAGYKFLGIIHEEGKVIGALVKMGQRKVGWKPVVKDGDALRLAVQLRIDICFGHDFLYTQTTIAPTPMFKESVRDDFYAATRRAITRAAAGIGRTMP